MMARNSTDGLVLRQGETRECGAMGVDKTAFFGNFSVLQTGIRLTTLIILVQINGIVRTAALTWAIVQWVLP